MQTVQLTEFTIRTMTLKHANNSEQRTLNQYHYTVWPDHGVPECPSSLLTFVRKASRANPPDAGPMVSYLSQEEVRKDLNEEGGLQSAKCFLVR